MMNSGRLVAGAMVLLAQIGVLLGPVMPANAAPSTGAYRPHFTTTGVYALGDSVMLGASLELQRRGINVNALESRQWDQGVAILQYMRSTGALPRVVVVSLGTNGPITDAQFNSMMQVLRVEQRVVFVTVKEPRFWESTVNSVLRRGVARWRTDRIADWYSNASIHPEWTCCDGIHLDAAGARAYAAIVAKAITGP